MLTVASRNDLDKLIGKPPAAPAAVPAPIQPAPPPAPVALSPVVEQALAIMAQHITIAADMAAAAQESVVRLADRRNIQLEGEIVRDQHGKMAKVIITTKKL